MKRLITILILTICTSGFAQEKGNVVYQTRSVVGAAAWGGPDAVVQNAPYSATITNESVQTLADGNRIVQTTTGTTARDSQGRTRRDTALPVIGNLSATDAPHLVFIQDPVAKVSYTLNLSDKTAQKMQASQVPVPAGDKAIPSGPHDTFFFQTAGPGPMGAPPLATLAPPKEFMIRETTDDHAQAKTEDLGSQTMEGVVVNGTRTTRTIPAGEIGNEKPISIVTEVWSSPDLKTIVYSKRSDPRMGEQTFRLTNIERAEPDPSLFTVPADFKVVEGPKPIIYRRKQ